MIEIIREIIRDILDILVIGLYLVIICIHIFKPYYKKKLENLATKQDIKEITREQEIVINDFKETFKVFSTEYDLKMGYTKKRYINLYSELNKFIIHSENLRKEASKFNELNRSNGYTTVYTDINYSDLSKYPYLELYTNKAECSEKDHSKFNEFCKRKLVDLIIRQGKYSSSKLLEVSINYRIISDYAKDIENKNIVNKKIEEYINDREVELIKEIIEIINDDIEEIQKILKL